jgi:beta-N-acetylhexosaminidase
MTKALQRAAGSLLVVGLAGTELTALERAWLKLVRPAGVILFKRNIADARQTRALLEEATGLCGKHGFRCVDVEGGTVDRLRDALAPMPSAQRVARVSRFKRGTEALGIPRSPSARDLGHPVGKPSANFVFPTHSQKARINGTQKASDLAREHGELVGRAVLAFGFNTTLAPVLDLGLPASAKVMGTRVAAESAAGVVEYAHGFLVGLAAQGVVGCGKHFPGLGGGALDSHLETPEIRRGWRELWNEDLVPYRELRDELPMVMVNHAAYPDTPGKDRPASVSPYWISNVLRKRIGYRGIVFSDDLEMGGILKYLPMEEAAVGAVRAGTDLLEICHSRELILRAYEALISEGERSAVFRKLLLARAARNARMRAKIFAGGVPAALSARQFEALRTKILRFGETIARAQETLPA